MKIFVLKLVCLFLTISLISLSSAIPKTGYFFDRSIIPNFPKDLSKVIAPGDIKIYYKIYLAQRNGMYKKADNLIAGLQDPQILGYLYYFRYIANDYISTFTELKNWLDKYYMLPVASHIYFLANKKAKNNSMVRQLKKPIAFNNRVIPAYKQHLSMKDQDPIIRLSASKKPNLMSSNLTYRISQYLKSGKTLPASNLLKSEETKVKLDVNTFTHYSFLLAKSYFMDGHDSQAIVWGKQVIASNHSYYRARAHFVLGLVYYRLGQYGVSVEHFNYVVQNRADLSNDIVSKAAYWLAKSSNLIGDNFKYIEGLSIASQYVYDFYGILANFKLGLKPQYSWQYLDLSPSSTQILTKYDRGARALALLQFGMLDWAEQELILLAMHDFPKIPEPVKMQVLNALVYMAQDVNMPALGFKLSGQYGKYYGLSHLSYPVFFLNLKEGYEVDPALIMAFIRKESNFFSSTKSYAGAIGLMQLMPSTANWLVKQYDDLFIDNIFSLYVPHLNVQIGQRYILKLLNYSQSSQNLVHALAGFNAGFSNLVKWSTASHRISEDPLFFIESIPFSETQSYVKQVLADYWIYQLKFNLIPHSLIDIIYEEYPLYRPLSNEELLLISNFKYN